jgi:hypothetical protein
MALPLARLAKELDTAFVDDITDICRPFHVQAARSILEVAKEFNVKTIDKLKVELQKARLVESLEAALQQSIKELALVRRGGSAEAQNKPPEAEVARVKELEVLLAKFERENAALRQEVRRIHQLNLKGVNEILPACFLM